MGVRTVKQIVEACAQRGVEALTLFAFSSENWQRPREEVTMLMGRFLEALDNEIDELHRNGVRLRFIGDRQALSVRLQSRMGAAEELTAGNTVLNLQLAVSYGGRWDILQAARRLAAQVASGALRPEAIDEQRFASELALAQVGDPDLFIRTGGDHRISNFLLWNLAYTELHICDTLWPDFDVPHLEAALVSFTSRERRFGLTGDQVRGAARSA
jgi:undecaprenyl diphosphate synthase